MSDFLTSARARLEKLEARHRAGKIDAASYDTQRRAIERELSDRLLAAGPASEAAAEATPAEAPARPSGRMVVLMVTGVLAVAIGGYLATGSPSLAGRTAVATAVPEGHPGVDPSASGAGSTDAQQQVAAMVDKLAARMKDRPDDFDGWNMLARSYTVLGRFADALPAYARASALQPKNANLLADYADAVAATHNTANNPQTIELVERALAIEPDHPKALALAGTADYDRGDYARAIARWQKIVDKLPPGTEIVKQIEGSIAEAREKLASTGLVPPPAALPPATTRPDPAPATPPVATATPPATASPGSPAAPLASVSGTVSLDPALAAKVAPGDTVFIYARAAAGSRMPLALQRARVSDLPIAFRLDDGMAMASGANLSSVKQVIVAARVSKSGSAMAQPGDLTGESAPTPTGASGIAIKIDKAVGSGS